MTMDKERVRLDQLKQGERGIVVGFKAGHGLVDKLTAIGVRPGKEITKVSDTFIGGPITIKVDNTKIAIGNGMAAKILVEVDD